MTEAMKLRGFAPRTQQSYLAAVTALAKHYRTPPDQLDFEKIKAYLLYLTVERALSWSTCNVAVSAFRFFYSEVLGWEKVSLPIPSRKKPKTLPVLLSRQELDRLFACAQSTHRVALSNNRILAVAETTKGPRVTFSYRDRKDSNRTRTMSLQVDEFIRRFLLHVLPNGFMRIRHFGFLANRSRKQKLDRCRVLLGLELQPAPTAKKSARQLMLETTGVDLSRCPACAVGTLVMWAQLPAIDLAPGSRRGPPLDSS
jgi:integrase